MTLRTLAALGTGFDCASKGEIAKIKSFGTASDSIIYANPNKPVSHLKFAAQMKVNLMTVDSEFEMRKIARYFPTARLVGTQLEKCLNVQSAVFIDFFYAFVMMLNSHRIFLVGNLVVIQSPKHRNS